MKLVINVSLLVAGTVVMDLDSAEEQGTITVVHDQTMQYATTQVASIRGEETSRAEELGKDTQLQAIAALRLIARAHERQQEHLAKSADVIVIPEGGKKEDAN